VTFFRWGPIALNTCGVQLAVVSAARFIELLVLTSLLTFSTTVTELTLGTEQLLSPLSRFNFPAHELALTMTIALRFIPTLAEELERIMKAQVSRGADLDSRGACDSSSRLALCCRSSSRYFLARSGAPKTSSWRWKRAATRVGKDVRIFSNYKPGQAIWPQV